MSSPYGKSVVAEFLGVREDDVTRLIKEDGLPAILVPTRTRPADKITLLGLHRWVTRRSSGVPLSVDDLETEMERASRRLTLRRKMKNEKLEMKNEKCGEVLA